MKISVFICTYNRGKLISGTLKSIINNQTIKPDEIVVVNGGGENNCAKTLDYWKTKFDSLVVIETKNINLSVSRNIGLPHCTGEIIMQTDDDARPFPNWIEQMVEFHKKFKTVGVIGGTVVDGSRSSFLSQVADASTFPRYQEIQFVRSVPGVNSSYKKEVIQKVGKYDESLFRGEDVDYNWRVKLCGWDVLYVPTIKVEHIHRSNWYDLIKQHFMYGRAHYLVRSKWPEMYSHYPIKISSIKLLLKWFASWLLIPLIDAKLKAKRFNQMINGFDILTLLFVNLSNRIGSSYQKIKAQLNLV
tara:strand:- start:556 stop:1461 length:906 start_codon:yes stop_codon:yes gene_type:complete